ncbi:MAG: 50S ribosomal protein L32 [bacterium]|nr:50S ribosomal protein L32 [bacterium]
MALPGHRRTSSHRKRRRSHHALKKTNLAACASCGKPSIPHRACAACGMYNGRAVVTVRARKAPPTAKTARSGKR